MGCSVTRCCATQKAATRCWSVPSLPEAAVHVDRPRADASLVCAWGDRLVLGEGGKLRVEIETASPPVPERHLASAHRPEPIGRFALDRQLEPTGREELDALEAQPRRVHGVLGVVA